jgi:uncharacterized membrane protein
MTMTLPPGPQAPLPPRLERYYAAGAQCIGTALAFFLTAVVKLPVPLYFPLSRRWSLVPNTEELSMDFFGRSLLAIGVGALLAALTLGLFAARAKLATKTPTEPSAKASSGSGLALLTGYALTAVLLAMGVFAYQLYGRTPTPEPLPPGFSVAVPGPGTPTR